MERKLLPRLKFTPEQTISNQIYNFLREMIIVRSIQPGTPLSENDLATHFDVSRHPVREALTRLKRDGLIEILPQRGSFVTKISVKNLQDICFVRSSIEINALRLGITRGGAPYRNAISRMERNIARQRQLKNGEPAKFLKLDDAFHEALCSMSGTDFAWQTIQDIKANMDRIRFLSIDAYSDLNSLVETHERIFEAIRNGDFDQAVAAIEPHHYEITRTSVEIREANREWFSDEEHELRVS